MVIKLLKSKQSFIFSVSFLLLVQFASAQIPTNKQIIAKADEYLKAAVKNDRFIGSILIAKNGVPILNKGYGMANIELNVPNTPKMIFRTASLTKQFTSMAIMQLQERGKLKVSDPICKYLEDCPTAWQSVTIRHLLTHTSGIKNYSSLPDWDEKLSIQPFTQTEVVKLFRDLPLDFTPGEKHKYSNSGYFLLGLIIEKTSGKKYTEFVQENIFVPLGMKNTGIEDPQVILQNRAAGYDWSLGSFANSRYMNMETALSAGSIYSTTEDLLLWDQALYTKKLVSQKSHDEIFTPFLSEYAYGWRTPKRFNRQTLEHSGSINGFSSFILRVPSERLTIIILSNSDKTSATKAANNLAAISLGETYKIPLPQIGDVIATTIVQKGIESALKQYRELKQTQADKYDFREHLLDELGWDLIKNKKMNEAIEIFKLNIEGFPKSANAHDSLGEAYLLNKNYDLALANFKKFLELDAQSNHAKEMITKVEEILKKEK
jgi:CubicO group peptidase (beta-lactamase class C family)